MGRGRFFGRIGHQIATMEFDLLQHAAEQIGAACGLVAQFGQRIAQLRHRMFLEREARFEFDDARLQRIRIGRDDHAQCARIERPRPIP
jgi:hypothetical protein